MAQPRKPRPAATNRAANRSVEKPREIALLAAPARQELVDTLESLGGEASVATLAAQLGRDLQRKLARYAVEMGYLKLAPTPA